MKELSWNNNIVYTFMTHFLLKVCHKLEKSACYFQLVKGCVFIVLVFGDFF